MLVLVFCMKDYFFSDFYLFIYSFFPSQSPFMGHTIELNPLIIHPDEKDRVDAIQGGTLETGRPEIYRLLSELNNWSEVAHHIKSIAFPEMAKWENFLPSHRASSPQLRDGTM